LNIEGDEGMNTLDRFESICRFEKPDRPPRWETYGFWTSTVERWHKEGLPAEVDSRTIRSHFGMDDINRLPVTGTVTVPPIFPHFEPKIIEETEAHVIGRDEFGLTYRRPKQGAEPGTVHYIGFPLKSRADWDMIRARINPETRSYDHLESIARTYNRSAAPNLLDVIGLYGMPRMLAGEEGLSYLYYDDPELVRDIQRHWLGFYCEHLRRVTERVRVDCILFWEDMAFKNGPLISPELFREFMLPYYREFIAHCRALGIKHFMVDSDGNNDVLIPLFIEAGVTIFSPFEVPAGNDVREVRRRYPQLVIAGGIDKRTLFEDRDAIRREVDRVVPWMWERGGYFPSLDHATPPNVSLANWEFYLEYLRGVFK
jgi:uroporphyrinogen decarboxylase